MKRQERLQFVVQDEDPERHEWASDRSARAKKGTPGREGHKGGDWTSKSMDNAVFYNSLPPGSNVADAEMSDTRVEDVTGPFGNGSQFTNDLTAESVRKGYSPKPLDPTDDNRAKPDFYDSVTVDGKTGFLERRNCLDRN